MNPLCLIVGHHRSRSKAVEDNHFGWRSVCERCGAPMVRLRHQTWVLESDAPPRPGAAPQEDARAG
jgi:hypothetical protein